MDDLREVIARAVLHKRELDAARIEARKDDCARSGCQWYDTLEEADAALAAIKAAGCVVVPAEPTEAMVEAFGNATGFDFHNSIADGYRAMIEASNAPT